MSYLREPSLPLTRLSASLPIQQRGTFDQQRVQVVRALLRIDDDNERSLRRNGNEVRVRNFISLSARGMNFVGDKRHRAVEFPDRLDNHDTTYGPNW